MHGFFKESKLTPMDPRKFGYQSVIDKFVGGALGTDL